MLASRLRGLRAAVLGLASFVLLVLGYALVAGWNALFYDPRLFSSIGLLAGPVVGLTSAWLREQGLRAALGTAVLAGIQLAYAFLGSRGAA